MIQLFFCTSILAPNDLIQLIVASISLENVKFVIVDFPCAKDAQIIARWLMDLLAGMAMVPFTLDGVILTFMLDLLF